MANAEFKFEDKQWQKLLKKINTKWKDIGDRKKFSDLVSIVVFKDIIDHFDQEQGPDGKWIRWSDLYRKHLEKIGRGGNKILNFSGRLRGSITPQKGKKKTSSLGVLLYSNIEYAAAHQYGNQKRNLPARPFMWLSGEGMKNLVQQTQKWLLED